jgi:type I restriction enzyme M protein
VVPKSELVDEEHLKNNLPDVLAQWVRLRSPTAENLVSERLALSEAEVSRTEQSFCVPKAEIAANGYDLSLNRYKEVVHEEVEHLPPLEVLQTLAELEEQIQQGMKDLEGMLASDSSIGFGFAQPTLESSGCVP